MVMKSCTCGLFARMNAMVATAAIEELRKHDPDAADRIVATANQEKHRDWCGSATKWLERQRKSKSRTIYTGFQVNGETVPSWIVREGPFIECLRCGQEARSGDMDVLFVQIHTRCEVKKERDEA